MEKPTLVVLAAGIGRRYGGLKQLDPVGPSGELIIDYPKAFAAVAAVIVAALLLAFFKYSSTGKAIRVVSMPSVERFREQSDAVQEQIVPIDVPQRRADPISFAQDEGPRADASLESMAKLRPVFDKSGSVTAGNASGLNDAAAAVVAVEHEAGRHVDHRDVHADGAHQQRRGEDPDAVELAPAT